MGETCGTCQERNKCETPCKAVNDILWKDNRVMEKCGKMTIVTYPQYKEVRFSELRDWKEENFSTDDVVPWSSGDFKLRKTAVFVERFFNGVPCKELAERFGVEENTIVCMYAQALEHVERIIEALDARREGLKATKKSKFTDDQKFFLLVEVFGFNGHEVGRMFNLDHHVVSLKIKRMSDKYLALFSGEAPKEETPVDDPPINGKLTRADVTDIVDSYAKQGLSHRQAFKRIAERYAGIVGRPVSFRGIESRYYKATSKIGEIPIR